MFIYLEVGHRAVNGEFLRGLEELCAVHGHLDVLR
jgi:hypothetical protein